MAVRRLMGAALAVCLVAAAPASAAFPDDPPSDPEYDRAEESCATTSVNDEQHYFYSFRSVCTPNAPNEPSGMSIDKAWREFTAGSPSTVIAYIEGGINWQYRPEELADKVYLNQGELPPPTSQVDDGRLSAKDYAAGTDDVNANGVVDPEDIIKRFSNGVDGDGNGYVDDISGWDFYHDQNNPTTVDSAYDHANNQMEQAGAETDNAKFGAGLCPRCMILPVKAGAEALDRTDDLAEAWNFSADAGAKVIASVTADLGYSTFMRQTVESLWRRGVVMVEASNDFNSTDHQGGMFWPHVLPGNGMTPNSNGVEGPGANALTNSFKVRSGQTSWGAHNMFTVSTQGGSTSTSTPTLAGVMGLVVSHRPPALGDRPLSAAEAVQVVRSTAEDIVDTNPSRWPAKPGFDLQYGYGRPNVHEAMKAVSDGKVPPVGWIDSPEWYSLYDPTETTRVPVRGHVEARRSSGYRWRLEFAPGPEPDDGEFLEAGAGSGSAPFDGTLGTLDLSKVPASFWSKAFRLSQTKTLETNEHYTVTLRLRVTDAAGRTGEERWAIAVQRDPSWAPNFPKRIGPGGEAQAALADLQGRGHLAIVFGDTDGRVHAVDGRSGEELPGWPQRTNPTQVTKSHPGVAPGHEPIVSNVAVGDLDHTGALSVVATSTTGRTYVWDARGRRRPGWPKTLDEGAVRPPTPRPQREFTRDPVQGAFAAPVLTDLDGDRRLEVVQGAWNGRLYAWRADGTPAPGWPRRVFLPPSRSSRPGHAERIQDHKLITPPAVAQLDADPRPELVVRSQFSDVVDAGIQPGGRAYLHGFHHDGSPVGGYSPRPMDGVVEFYGSGQEFITEGSNAPAAGDVDADGRDEIASGPVFSPTYLFDSAGDAKNAGYGPTANSPIPFDGADVLSGNLPTDTPVSFAASGAFGRFGDRFAYAEPGSGVASTAVSLLLTGSGFAIRNVMRSYDAGSGVPTSPAFPAKLQGLDFLGAPVFADVTGDGKPELLEGGDSSALHGYTPDGRQAAGFPKFHTGWVLYAPSVGDLDSDGRSEVVALTREGYLMAWRTPGTHAGNQEWWSYRHDEHNSARHGVDARPPGVVRGATLDPRTGRLSFQAPGDDWYAGTVSGYRVTVPAARAASGGQRRVRVAAARRPRAEPAGGDQRTLALPAGTRQASVQAVDDAGNLGGRVTVTAGSSAGPPATSQPSPTKRRTGGRDDAGRPAAGSVAAGGSGQLPSTGFFVLVLLIAGAVLATGGRELRRRTRS